MMRSDIILLVFIAQTKIIEANDNLQLADKVIGILADKLINRAFESWPLLHTESDLDNVVFAKPASVPVRGSLATLPAVQPSPALPLALRRYNEIHAVTPQALKGPPWIRPRSNVNSPRTSTVPLSASISTLDPRSSEIPKVIELLKQNEGESKEVILKYMEAMSEQQKGDRKTLLPDDWKLKWTTEKEINFFYTWPFAKPERISQKVDVSSMTIQNLIVFEGGGQLAVSGILERIEGSRCYFKFETAKIKAFGREFSIPPVGAGWFETMYVNDRWRLSRDNRGDYSILERA